mmetsp:Transcript_12114/g.48761  ORF Transcript_12114/g.48761 Transcript_12114/m.48761 type:complete len:366 (-) Transcript_12114:181-1278(-)
MSRQSTVAMRSRSCSLSKPSRETVSQRSAAAKKASREPPRSAMARPGGSRGRQAYAMAQGSVAATWRTSRPSAQASAQTRTAAVARRRSHVDRVRTYMTVPVEIWSRTLFGTALTTISRDAEARLPAASATTYSTTKTSVVAFDGLLPSSSAGDDDRGGSRSVSAPSVTLGVRSTRVGRSASSPKTSSYAEKHARPSRAVSQNGSAPAAASRCSASMRSRAKWRSLVVVSLYWPSAERKVRNSVAWNTLGWQPLPTQRITGAARSTQPVPSSRPSPSYCSGHAQAYDPGRFAQTALGAHAATKFAHGPLYVHSSTSSIITVRVAVATTTGPAAAPSAVFGATVRSTSSYETAVWPIAAVHRPSAP